MSLITSRQNSLIKHIVRLLDSARERRKSAEFILEGIHLAQACRDAGWPVSQLLVAESALRHPEIARLLGAWTDFPPIVLVDALFAQIFDIQPSVGIALLLPLPEQRAGGTSDFMLLLDDVQDPGNVGTIMRTAVAAGVEQIFLSPGCADVWSPKVLRAAMGAHFLVDISADVDLAELIRSRSNKFLVTDLTATQSLYQLDLRGPVAMIFGNEGAGVRAELRALASEKIIIPMPGRIESLNVAAAAAICLFECVRQRAQ